MKAVIMAGGFGTRIHPLTINIPKPMVPLVNRPILLHIIDLLKHHGITEMVMVLFHQPQIIKNFFGNGSEFGVTIDYIVPQEDFGTAGAVRAAAEFLDGRFLVISGDLLTDFNLSSIIDSHTARGAMGTLALTRVADPLQFGVVITDEGGRITRFQEKPGWGEVFSDTINTGIYVFERSVLDLIPEGENRDWSKDIFPLMLEQGLPLYGCNQSGYWQDVGNSDAYLDAVADICHGRIAVNIDEAASDSRRIHLGEGVQVDQEVSLLEGTVVIGNDTSLQGRVRISNSSIGRNCVIGDGAEIRNAVLWDNVYVGAGAKIDGAVLCNRVRVGRKASIASRAVVADETRIGDEASIARDVKLWPMKQIESGSHVSSNLIWGEKWRRNLFEGGVVRGLTNIELSPEFAAKLGAAFGSSLPKDSWVLASRDAYRASRMLKRAFIGGLLSTGVHVYDCKMTPLPVMRKRLFTFGEVGGIHFRQNVDDPAVTEILFFDAEGSEIAAGSAKGIERLFFKENFRRVHYTEPGSLSEVPEVGKFYQDCFMGQIDHQMICTITPRVVIDFNHSPAGDILPPLLFESCCRVIELNSHVEEGVAVLNGKDLRESLHALGQICTGTGALGGFWIGPSGEKLRMVDNLGRVLDGVKALELLVRLVCLAGPPGDIAVPVTAPSTIEIIAAAAGRSVVRTKNDGRSLSRAALGGELAFAGDLDGRYILPSLHPHFDALFCIVKLLEFHAKGGKPLSELVDGLPERPYVKLQAPCSWETKGLIMRKATEEAGRHERVQLIDGVRIDIANAWVLILPDEFKSVVHIIAEADDQKRAEALAGDFLEKVNSWKREGTQE